MKKIALVLLLLLSLCAHAYAANFVEVHRDDQRLVYVDTDSIGLRTSPNNDKYVVAWVKMCAIGDDFRNFLSSHGEGAEHYIFFEAYNKDIKQSQTLLFYVGYKNEKPASIASDYTFDVSNYKEIIPGTFNEKKYDFVMNYHNKNKNKK